MIRSIFFALLMVGPVLAHSADLTGDGRVDQADLDSGVWPCGHER